ncbi:DEAD/DEAH box helicase [Alkalimarinus coralli]|uniref:DEAD/DEAH box helicase n=1 Tax=Alkalimarinus coralli TaxID=2935863 RepID=UPI00202B00B1|nr:DEAD/DEAH box helicase [Alkalimarinus coralli]
MLNKLFDLFSRLFQILGLKPKNTPNTGGAKPNGGQPASAGKKKSSSGHNRQDKAGKGQSSASQNNPKKDSPKQQKFEAKKRDTAKKDGSGQQKQKEWTADQFVVPPEEGKSRFHDFNLDNRLLHAIADLGFKYCSPIQAASLPYTLQGNDFIGKAQTGTGKTAAFLITTIQNFLLNPIPKEERYASEPRALIIAPTRELVMQIEKDAHHLTAHTDLQVYSVMGGIDYQKQRTHLRDKVVDILVATPGRLIDFLGSQDVFLDQVETLVIDEADRMLDMGFIPDVKRIIRHNKPVGERQTLLFSATFNDDVLNLVNNWTKDAQFIEIEAEQQTTEKVDQTVFMVSTDEKLTVICNYIQKNDVKRAIIFGNRRDETRRLQETIRRLGIKCALLSGEVPQHKRIKTLDGFKKGDIEILVATDVAGRGIHVDDVTHVFNYNLPEDPEDYVHRIGRTGRAGKEGKSISFACEDDAFLLPELERYIGMKLECTYPDETLTQK